MLKSVRHFMKAGSVRHFVNGKTCLTLLVLAGGLVDCSTVSALVAREVAVAVPLVLWALTRTRRVESRSVSLSV